MVEAPLKFVVGESRSETIFPNSPCLGTAVSSCKPLFNNVFRILSQLPENRKLNIPTVVFYQDSLQNKYMRKVTKRFRAGNKSRLPLQADNLKGPPGGITLA